jgi:FkbM family methyltransferase
MTLSIEARHDRADLLESGSPSRQTDSVRQRALRALHNLMIASVRPFVMAELPGSDLLYRLVIGRSAQSRLWQSHDFRYSRSKFHPYLLRFDLADPVEREAFFLKRWQDLATQVFARDLVRLGDTVLDIGTGRGMFAFHAAYLTGASGEVICMEPDPDRVWALEREIARNGLTKVQLVQAAAGHVDGVERFEKGRGQLATEFMAEVLPADSLLEGKDPVLVKISIGNTGRDVVRGLSETIKRCHPVFITDFSGCRQSETNTSAGEFMMHMANLGYLGFKIALSERSEMAHWSVRPLSPSDGMIKAIWVHEYSPADAWSKVLDRMTRQG